MAKFYHAEVKSIRPADSDQRAEGLARHWAGVVKSLGGMVDVVRMYGDAPAILACTFEYDVDLGVLNNLFGLEFREVHATQVQAVKDYGIPGD